MKRSLATILITILFLSVAVFAQAPPQAPKPGPELKRFDYFVGTWATEADMKPSPYGPGGKFTGIDRTEWMPGNFFLLIHSDFNSPMGPGKELAVMGYKTDDKVYTYNAYNSMGEADHSTGTVEGDTWTWMSNDKIGGKEIKGRFTMKIVSPTSYTFKYEMASETGEWATLMEGKATKK
ncbi:MAG TPA: DUF1579 family protein [Terriglobales bacterium]|jgi:hypothetical protein|nr:DUF1579 family protein [Terriglobales bacterium]